MSFLYAVPGKDNNNVTWEHFKHAFDGQPQRGLDQRGLTDEKTALLADQSVTTARMRIAKDRQTWRKVTKEEGIYWIGYWDDDPPTPETLRRKKVLKGEEVKTRAGIFTVPRAISFHLIDGETQTEHHLERYLDFLEDGTKVFGDVVDEFQGLHEIAIDWISWGNGIVDVEKIFDYAARVVGHNYRVDYEELCMLHALTEDIAIDIMAILVDTTAHSEIRDAVVEDNEGQKKSSPDEECSSSNGETAETIGTGQQ